jgi:hypothetical protein
MSYVDVGHKGDPECPGGHYQDRRGERLIPDSPFGEGGWSRRQGSDEAKLIELAGAG